MENFSIVQLLAFVAALEIAKAITSADTGVQICQFTSRSKSLSCESGLIHLTNAEVEAHSIPLFRPGNRFSCGSADNLVNSLRHRGSFDLSLTFFDFNSYNCDCNICIKCISLAYTCSRQENTIDLLNVRSASKYELSEGYIVATENVHASSVYSHSCVLDSAHSFSMTILNLQLVSTTLDFNVIESASNPNKYGNRSLAGDLLNYPSSNTQEGITVFNNLSRVQLILRGSGNVKVFIHFASNTLNETVKVKCSNGVESTTTVATTVATTTPVSSKSTPTPTTRTSIRSTFTAPSTQIPRSSLPHSTFSGQSSATTSRAFPSTERSAKERQVFNGDSSKRAAAIGGGVSVALLLIAVALILLVLKRKGKLTAVFKQARGRKPTQTADDSNSSNKAVDAYHQYEMTEAIDSNLPEALDNHLYEPTASEHSPSSPGEQYHLYDDAQYTTYDYAADDTASNGLQVQSKDLYNNDSDSQQVGNSAAPEGLQVHPNDMYEGNGDTPNMCCKDSAPKDLEIQPNELYEDNNDNLPEESVNLPTAGRLDIQPNELYEETTLGATMPESVKVVQNDLYGTEQSCE